MNYKYTTFALMLVIGIIILYLIYNTIFYNPKYNEDYRIIVNNKKYKPTKLMIVAHPDDETLWGYKYLQNNPRSWKVICLTCAKNKTRVNEFKTIMDKIGILNYEIWDHDNSIFAKKLDPQCLDNIKKSITKNDYKLIVTHNRYGEYGNLQHMSVHQALKKLKDQYNLPIKFFEMDKYRVSEKKDNLLKNYKSQDIIILMLRMWHRLF